VGALKGQSGLCSLSKKSLSLFPFFNGARTFAAYVYEKAKARKKAEREIDREWTSESD